MQLGRELPGLMKLAPSVCPLWKERSRQWKICCVHSDFPSSHFYGCNCAILFLCCSAEASCPHLCFYASFLVLTFSHSSVKKEAFRVEDNFKHYNLKGSHQRPVYPERLHGGSNAWFLAILRPGGRKSASRSQLEGSLGLPPGQQALMQHKAKRCLKNRSSAWADQHFHGNISTWAWHEHACTEKGKALR